MAESATQAIKRLREQNDQLLDAGSELAFHIRVLINILDDDDLLPMTPALRRWVNGAISPAEKDLAAWRRVA